MQGGPNATPTSLPWEQVGLRVATGFAVGLVVIGVLGQVVWHGWLDGISGGKAAKLIQMFNLEREANVPTWFSSVLLLACSALTFRTAGLSPERPFRRHWAALSLVFLYLSADETAQIHETLNPFLRAAMGRIGIGVPWDLVSLLLVAVVGVAFWRFLWHLPPRVRWVSVASAVLFVLGGAGIEVVGLTFFPNSYHGGTLAAAMVAAFEESLEMGGVLLFLSILVGYENRVPGVVAPRSVVGERSA